MTKRIQAKYKIDRRMGENIWGRPKSPINLRAYGPGQHGQGRKQKLSDFLIISMGFDLGRPLILIDISCDNIFLIYLENN